VGDKVLVRDETGSWIFLAKEVIEDGGVVTVVSASADDEEFGFELRDFYRYINVEMQYEGSDEEDAGYEPTASVRRSRSNTPENPNVIDLDVSAETSIAYNPITFETDHFKAACEVSGKISASLELAWDVDLLGEDYMKCDFSYSTDMGAKISIALKVESEDPEREERELRIAKIRIPFGVTGLDAFADIKAGISWSITAGVELTGHIKTTHGFKYNTKDGKQKIDKKEITWEVDAKGHAEVSFGPKPSIGIEFLGGVLSVEMECFFGAKAEGDIVHPFNQGGTSVHACDLCIDGEVKLVLEVAAKLKYKITEHIKGTPIDWTIVSIEKKLFDFYISLANDPNGMFGGHIHKGKGTCPNMEYLTTFRPLDASGQEAAVPVMVTAGDRCYSADPGESIYLPPATYVASAEIDGVHCEKTFTISSAAKTVTISENCPDGSISGNVVDAATSAPVAGASVEVYEYATLVATAVTDDNGAYSISLAQGDYSVVISADGYISATQYVSLRDGENKFLDSLLLAGRNGDRIMGGIYGIINDGVTGRNLEGVTVSISRGWDNFEEGRGLVAIGNTDADGRYAYKKWSLFGIDFGLDAGNYTITISKTGYISTTFNVTVVGGMDLEFNSTLTPVGAENVYKIVLTWGETPSDLDSHLNGVCNGTAEHVYYRMQTGDGANLDVDDTSSYGPETIGIPDLTVYSGNVMYSVHDFSNRGSESSAALSSSGATVKVYKGGTLEETFYVPTGMIGTVWNVFYIDEESNIVPVNSFEFISSPEAVCGRDS
ncbi:MAG: carboxypeptidase regulatory-like domain-containing protein, partial [Clostridiales bacterium]|nr:carboxypeptidase regulatory-like domain-containing protein [Clostridiales bacterium]